MAKCILIIILLTLWTLINSSIYGWTHRISIDKVNLSYALYEHQQYLQNKHPIFDQFSRHQFERQHWHNTCCDQCEQLAKTVKTSKKCFAVKCQIGNKSSYLKEQPQHRQLFEQSHNHQIKRSVFIPRMQEHITSIEDQIYGDATGHSNTTLKRLVEIIQSPLRSNKNHNGSSGDGEDQVDNKYSPKSGVLSPKLVCPKCENKRQVLHITAEELTRLRILFVKQQILEKLRLKERPNVSAIGLPKPIYESTTIQHGDEKTKNKELDNYYAKTRKKFIFLERERKRMAKASR